MKPLPKAAQCLEEARLGLKQLDSYLCWNPPCYSFFSKGLKTLAKTSALNLCSQRPSLTGQHWEQPFTAMLSWSGLDKSSAVTTLRPLAGLSPQGHHSRCLLAPPPPRMLIPCLGSCLYLGEVVLGSTQTLQQQQGPGSSSFLKVC